MILDKLSNANLYANLHPRLKTALSYLQEQDLNALEVGTYPIEGDKVFLMIQEYETKPDAECRYEAHYKYTDIQYMVQGHEKMGYTDMEHARVVEEIKEKDVLFLEADGDILTVREGSFVIFSPTEAHKPLICVDEPQAVKKAVVKVLCE